MIIQWRRLQADLRALTHRVTTAAAKCRCRVGTAALAAFLLSAVIIGASAQVHIGRKPTGPRPLFVTGQALVWVRAGAGALSDVQQAVKAANCEVLEPLMVPGAYLLSVHGQAGKPVTDADTQAAITQLNQNAMFRYVGPNRLHYLMDTTPNDPLFPQQWNLALMNMPKAWDLQKGSANIKIAIIDSGFDVNHPDLKDRMLPGINVSGTGASNDLTEAVGAVHGTFVAGVAAATSNNSTGIAGVCLQGAKIIPIKVGAVDGTINEVAVVNGLVFAQAQGANIVNLSLGALVPDDAPNLSDIENAQILTMAQNGIIFTISAGNDFLGDDPAGSTPNSPVQPANMASVNPNILCVAACGSHMEHAAYSEARPYTTITCPGGNPVTVPDPSEQILSTFATYAKLSDNTGYVGSTTSGYAFGQGTSFSAPACAGVVALLLSTPGVTPSSIRGIIQSSVFQTGLDPSMFGAGVLDAYQALLKVTAGVTVIQPDGVGGKSKSSNPKPVETLRPLVQIQVARIPVTNLVITVDNVNVPSSEITITDVTATGQDSNGNTVPTTYIAQFDMSPAPNAVLGAYTVGQHTVVVNGTTSDNPPVPETDTRTFTITPHTFPIGRSFISIPYFEDVNPVDGLLDAEVTPEYYFQHVHNNETFRLARWVPTQMLYAFYDSSTGRKDIAASFRPTDILPHQDGDTTVKDPIGIAYWANTNFPTPILTLGKALTDKAFIIPLHGTGNASGEAISWNMVGDPFPFDVAFNALLVDTPSGRLTIQDAVNRGFLMPNIYTYDGTSGYLFNSLPAGTLTAWSGHWIGVTSSQDIALVVPPANSSRAAQPTGRAATAGNDGWKVRLSAHVGTLNDTYNFIGVSSRATDTFNLNDVPKPPLVSPYVSVGVLNANWGKHSGIYAQDLRGPSGAKTWSVVVDTDQPNSDVTLNWGATAKLPSNVKLMIKDEATGQVIDMQTRSATTFHTGATVTTRRFTITSKPAAGSTLRISNVIVSRPTSRAVAGSTIGFSLSADANYIVDVLSADGRTLGTLATRAAAAGDVHLVWNGKDGQGRTVPSGVYLIQIRATTSDGQAVRVIQPLTIVR